MKEMKELRGERPLYFVGIGGAGMYPLARLALSLGYTVLGCDRAESENLRRLRRLGVSVEHEHEQIALPCAAAVVYTLAAPPSHPILKEAGARDLPIITRTELLGYLSSRFARCATVAGTHGKSSTVGLCTSVLKAAGLRPTVLCGADLTARDGGFLEGDKDLLLLEACEYKSAFLSLAPTHALALGADYEHPDCFRDEEAVKRAFQSYLRLPSVKERVTPVGFCEDGVTFGEGGLFHKSDTRVEDGRASFALYRGKNHMGHVRLSVLGEYQAENAVAAAALCHTLGVSDEAIIKGLSSFSGIGGRMELRGCLCGAPVYLDYAHHPVELAAAIRCASSLGKKVVCVFEGHTYSRVRAFEKDFARVLSVPYRTGILPIFPAREVNTLGMSGEKMARDAQADFLPNYHSAAEYLEKYASPDTVLLVVGAGGVGKVLSFLTLTALAALD